MSYYVVMNCKDKADALLLITECEESLSLHLAALNNLKGSPLNPLKQELKSGCKIAEKSLQNSKNWYEFLCLEEKYWRERREK